VVGVTIDAEDAAERIAVLILPVTVALPDSPVDVHCCVMVPVSAFAGIFKAHVTTTVIPFETLVP
jgi:hypothetical protein